MQKRPDQTGRGRAIGERLAWTAGVLLLGTYFAVATFRSSQAGSDLAAFDRLRGDAQAAAPAGHLEEPKLQDFKLWSEVRIKGYRESLSATHLQPLAVLEIPRLGLRAAILEGTDDLVLNRGLGHIEGTPLPGAAGNVGIAGHRDGIFRCLKDIATGDRLRLLTVGGQTDYLVAGTQVVDPETVAVLDPTPESALTLVTCFPFYYSGNAPKRFIVRAYRVPPQPGPGPASAPPPGRGGGMT